MSVLTSRAAIAQKFALQELHGGFQQYLAEHTDAVDADGNQVLCLLAPEEPAHQMMVEALRYPHPVLVGSDVDGRLMAVQLGDFGIATPAREDEEVVRIGDQSVLDVMRRFRDLAQERGGEATGIVLEFSLNGDRVLVTA